MVIWINVSWRSNQWVLHVKQNLEVDHIIRSKWVSEQALWVHVCVLHCSFLVLTMVLFLFGNWVVKVEGFHVILIGKTLIQATSYNYGSSPSWMNVTSTMASSTFQCQIITYFVLNARSSWNWSGMPTTTCTVVKVAWLQKHCRNSLVLEGGNSHNVHKRIDPVLYSSRLWWVSQLWWVSPSLTSTAARARFHEAGLPHPHLYHHNKNQCVCSGTGFEITFIPKVNFFADVKSSFKKSKNLSEPKVPLKIKSKQNK